MPEGESRIPTTPDAAGPRLEDELRLYKRLVEDLNDAVYRIAPDGTVQYVSPTISRLTGFVPDELTGRNFRSFVFPPDLPVADSAVVGVMTGNPFPVEFRLRRKDGGTVWVRSSGRAIRGESGIVGIQGILVDFSDRRDLEDRVARRVKDLSSPLPEDGEFAIREIVDVGALQVLMDRLYAVNGIPSAVQDVSENLLVASGWQDICLRFHRTHPESAQCCRESDAHIKEHLGEGKWIEHRCRNGLVVMAMPMRAGERHVGTLVLGQLFYEGEEPGEDYSRDQARRYDFDMADYLEAYRRVPVFTRDRVADLKHFYEALADGILTLGVERLTQARTIEQLREAEEARTRSEGRFQAMFEHMASGVAIYEPVDDCEDFVVTDINPAGERNGEVVADEVRGKRVRDVFPGVEKTGLFDAFRRVCRTGELVRLPVSHYQDDRLNKYLENYVVRLPSGEIMAVYDDITERLRAESDRLELEAQLHEARKMESVGRLAGGVAHDFNNILQAIAGYTELAMGEAGNADAVRASLEQVGYATARAASLVRQLLVFSRAEALQIENTDLNALLRGLEPAIRRILGKNTDLRCGFTEGLSPVAVDTGQIEQVVTNLCLNAQDAMPEGGVLTVSTCRKTVSGHEQTMPLVALPGEYVCLSVSDTGKGMDPETMAHAFEPFFTTKGVGEGSGLGLSTAYAVAERHDGFVHIESEEGRGTTVHFCLPCSPATVQQTVARGGDGDEAPLGDGETVLFAEDDEMVRGVGRRILEWGNYQVLVARDGREAVDLFRERADEIDVAVLDIIMPGCSGRQVQEAIQETHPRLPIIFASGYSHEALAPEHQPPGAFRILRKPFLPTYLLQCLHEALHPEEA